jgi:hypothetical protein
MYYDFTTCNCDLKLKSKNVEIIQDYKSNILFIFVL